MTYNKLTLDQSFVYLTIVMCALFLAYSEFFKNLSIVLMFFYLLYHVLVGNLTIKRDLVNIALIIHLLVVLIGVWTGINYQETLTQFSDILKIVIVFLFFREVNLSFISLQNVIVFLIIGFIATVGHSMADYLIYGSDFLKLNSVGSINRSATYIMYIFIVSLVLKDFFQSKYVRILLFFGLVISVSALILGGSRMVIFSLPIIIALYIFLQKKYSFNKFLLLGFLSALLAIIIIFLFPDSRVSSRFYQGFSDPARMQIWMSSIYAWWSNNIFFGIGVGNSIFIDVADYFDNAITRNIDNTHQLYLDMLLERGFLGFVTFFTFLGSLLFFDVKKERKTLIQLLIFSMCLMGFANITFRYEFALLFVIIIGSILNSSLKKY